MKVNSFFFFFTTVRAAQRMNGLRAELKIISNTQNVIFTDEKKNNESGNFLSDVIWGWGGCFILLK